MVNDDNEFRHPVIVWLTVIMVLVVVTAEWLREQAVRLWAPSDMYDWDRAPDRTPLDADRDWAADRWWER